MFAIRRSFLLAPSGIRAFSRSAIAQRGGLPVFIEPSTPALSTLLATFNSKILLPAHLSKEQEVLVYSRDGQTKLRAEPVEVTIGDVTLPLEPLNRSHLPARWETFRDILDASKTRQDFENVLRVFEGLENAGLAPKPQWRELLVRRLAQNNMYSVLLKALQRPKASGMRLSSKSLVRSVVRAVHDRAAGDLDTPDAARWDKDNTAAALRLAHQITELIEDPEHHAVAATGNKSPAIDYRGHPLVIAMPTALAARAAERHAADTAPVATLAARLVTAMQQSDYNTHIFAVETYKNTYTSRTAQSTGLSNYCHELHELLVIYNALSTSRRVLGTDMPSATVAAEYEAKLESVLASGIEVAHGLTTFQNLKIGKFYADYIDKQFAVCRAA